MAPTNASVEEPRYHAELYEWSCHWIGADVVAIGRIRHDVKERWPDGHAILTSAIVGGEMMTGGVIQTRNTRYLLSGPQGDLKALLQQGRDLMANGERRQRVASTERLFDLLPAAWGLTDEEFERLAGLPERWMWEWRNHYRSPLDEELAIASRLMSFHATLSMTGPVSPNYAKWWRRAWNEKSIIGARTPLQAIEEDGEPALRLLEHYLWAAAQW